MSIQNFRKKFSNNHILYTVIFLFLFFFVRELYITSSWRNHLSQNFNWVVSNSLNQDIKLNLKLLDLSLNEKEWYTNILAKNKSNFYFNNIKSGSEKLTQISKQSGNSEKFLDLVNELNISISKMQIDIKNTNPNVETLLIDTKRLKGTTKNIEHILNTFKVNLQQKNISLLYNQIIISTIILFLAILIVLFLWFRRIRMLNNKKSNLTLLLNTFIQGKSLKKNKLTSQKLNQELEYETLMQFQNKMFLYSEALEKKDIHKAQELMPFEKESPIGQKYLSFTQKINDLLEETNIEKNKNIDLLKFRQELSVIEKLLRENSGSKDLYIKLLKELISFLDLNQGGIFLTEKDENDEYFLELKASFAYNTERKNKKTIAFKEGLIGTAAYEQNIIILDEIPSNYLEINSGLGEIPPKYLFILPIIYEDETLAVIELASFNPLNNAELDFLKNLTDTVSLFIASSSKNSLKLRINNDKLFDFINKIDSNEYLSIDSLINQTIQETFGIAIFDKNNILINYTRHFQNDIPFPLHTNKTELADIIRINDVNFDLFKFNEVDSNNIFPNFKTIKEIKYNIKRAETTNNKQIIILFRLFT